MATGASQGMVSRGLLLSAREDSHPQEQRDLPRIGDTAHLWDGNEVVDIPEGDSEADERQDHALLSAALHSLGFQVDFSWKGILTGSVQGLAILSVLEQLL